jgi:hypothetical protein
MERLLHRFCEAVLLRISLLRRSRGEEGSSDHRVEPPTPTLKLIIRERVRTLDLASGKPECSLVSLRAGSITHAASWVPRGGRKVPKMVAHGGPALGSYSTLKLWRRASLERLFSARSRTMRSGDPPLMMSGWSRAQTTEKPGCLGGGIGQARLDTRIVTLRPTFVYDADGHFLRGGHVL